MPFCNFTDKEFIIANNWQNPDFLNKYWKKYDFLMGR